MTDAPPTENWNTLLQFKELYISTGVCAKWFVEIDQFEVCQHKYLLCLELTNKTQRESWSVGKSS